MGERFRLCGHAALRRDVFGRFARKIVRHVLQRIDQMRFESMQHRALAERSQRGELHAVGRKHAREGMDEDARHAERVGDEARMLPTRTAETVEHVAAAVITLRDRNALDGVRHVLDRDADETVRDRFRCVAQFVRECRETVAHSLFVERFVGAGSEKMREEFAAQLAHHHIRIGDGQRPAAAVAGWPRIGAGGIRAYSKARAVKMQDRAAAGCHCVDRHHRHAQAHACHFRFVDALERAVETRDIGGRAAHVEADDMIEARFARRLRHADYAASRA